MSAKRLQLSLLADPRRPRQHLPEDTRQKSVDIMARMLLRQIRMAPQKKEARDASR